SLSESETGLAGAVGQRRDPTVVLVAGAVQDHVLHPGGLRTLGETGADLLGLRRLVAVGGTQVGLHRGGRGHGPAGGIVDHLGEDVTRRAGEHQPRTLRRPLDLLAHTHLAAAAGRSLAGRSLAWRQRDFHGHLPAFPALRRMCSPAYLMPLPLYGSGLRSLRIVAATSPTACLSMPEILSLVGLSTVKVMPSGAVTGIECE